MLNAGIKSFFRIRKETGMNIGEIIYKERVKLNVSQKALAHGIVSLAEFSRIEHGEQKNDLILFEAIFQRLGKSFQKMEVMLSVEEYRIFLIKELIRQNLFQNQYDLAISLLKEYDDTVELSKPLHQQYSLQMHTVCEYLQDRNIDICLSKFKTALSITFPEWMDADWGDYRLGYQEIQILLQISFLMIELNQAENAQILLNKTLHMIEICYTDEEERVNLYPQCTWLLGKLYRRIGQRKKADSMYRAGKECLRNNGALLLLSEFCIAEENTDEAEAVRYLQYLADYQPLQDEFLFLLLKTYKNEFIVSNELIRELRQSHNLSQEKLSEDICTQETLSRIEGGRREPNQKKLRKLLERLGLEREKYLGFIVADDYEVYELVRKYHKYRFQSEKATTILDEIERKLDLSVAVNRQYIETARLQEAEHSWKKPEDYKNAITELEKILRYTMKEYDGTVTRVPSREECTILNQIALYKKKLEDYEGAIDIYEQLLKKYYSSSVLEESHNMSILLIYLNYAGILEVIDDLGKAKEIGTRGIKLAVKCERGDIAALLLGNMACVYEKMGMQNEERMCLKYCYYLLLIYGYSRDAEIIIKAYEEKFSS